MHAAKLTASDNGVFFNLSGGGNSIDGPALNALVKWRQDGYRGTLLIIVNIDGKSPRSVGAQMAVREDGAIQDYLIGGCLEMELALIPRDLIAHQQNDLRRYGRGSPYVDLRLPCGLELDIYFDQVFDDDLVHEISKRLKARQYFSTETNLADGRKILVDLPVSAARQPQAPAEQSHFSKLVKPALTLNVYVAGLASVQLAHMANSMGPVRRQDPWHRFEVVS